MIMNEQDFLNSIITQVDEMLDARGVEKARLGIEIIQKIIAVRDGLKKSDEAHAHQVKMLEDQIKVLTPTKVEGDVEIVGGETYTIDLTGGDAVETNHDE